MTEETKVAGLVTIDVEPDNVWNDTHSKAVENIKRLPSFHRLCQEYGVRPTYLVSWTVAEHPESARILETLLAEDDCEIGIHPHLWETPPITEQDGSQRAWVGGDYPEDVLAAKLANLTELIASRFGKPTSHRAGRWGLDPRQIGLLLDLGIRVDSSVTPGINWSSTGAPDYTTAPLDLYWMDTSDLCQPGTSPLLQVPCTIMPRYRFSVFRRFPLANRVARWVGSELRWLRVLPSTSSETLLSVCHWASQRFRCLNLMSHSSEFMAGGSPYWPTESAVEQQFGCYHRIFSWWREHGVEPKTLSEFAAAVKKDDTDTPRES